MGVFRRLNVGQMDTVGVGGILSRVSLTSLAVNSFFSKIDHVTTNARLITTPTDHLEQKNQNLTGLLETQVDLMESAADLGILTLITVHARVLNKF